MFSGWKGMTFGEMSNIWYVYSRILLTTEYSQKYYDNGGWTFFRWRKMPRVLWINFFDSIFKTGMNCRHMGTSSSANQNNEVAQTRLDTRLILFIYFTSDIGRGGRGFVAVTNETGQF